MWRISRQINVETAIKISRVAEKQKLPRRRVHSLPDYNRKSGGKGKIVLGLTGTTFAAVGGTVAYAAYDDSFRNTIEENVPLSATVFEYILGKKESQIALPPPKPLYERKSISERKPSPAQTKKSAEEIASQSKPSIAQRKPTETPKKPEVKETPVTKHDSGSTPRDTTLTTALVTEAKSTRPEVDEKKLQERMNSQDLDAAADNAALEAILQDELKDVETAVNVAIKAHQEAQQSLKSYTTELEKNLDTKDGLNKENLRFRLESAKDSKNTALARAEEKFNNAREVTEKVRSTIRQNRRSKITADNPKLISSEEFLNHLTYKMYSASAQTAAVKSDSRVWDEYRVMVEKSREDFQKEMAKIIPLLADGVENKEELKTLIRKSRVHIEKLKEQLSLLQLNERQRLKSTLETRRQEYDNNLQTFVTLESNRRQQELDVRFEQKVAGMKEDFEYEVRAQLRRQAAAHSDHLQEMLHKQQQELDKHYSDVVEDKVSAARQEFEADLAKSYARLKGIEEGLKARAELNWAAKTSQVLWLACQSLHNALKSGLPEKLKWEDQLRSLKPEIDVVKNALQTSKGNYGDYVVSVLQAIPEEATTRGIYPESALKERFYNVYKTCCRVALVGDDGGSLLRYGLSYLQSFLMIDSQTRATVMEIANQPVDPSKLSAYEVLTRARWCVERDDLETALRFMNLLHGAPRRVARDWMYEVRLLLETRQAAEALIAMSAATGVQAYV